MPFIRMSEVETLIEIENHLGENENWSEHTTKLWEIIETLLKRQEEDAQRSKVAMRKGRAKDKNYGRGKKKGE